MEKLVCLRGGYGKEVVGRLVILEKVEEESLKFVDLG